MQRPNSGRQLRVVRLLPTLDFGGVESRVILQAQLHDRNDYELRVCTFHRAGNAAEQVRKAAVALDVLGQAPTPGNWRATRALVHTLRRLRPDVIHASIAEANFHSALASLFVTGTKLIVEEVGIPEHSRRARLAYRWVYHRADSAVGVTNATRNYMIGVDGSSEEKTRCIYNCAAAEFFPEAPNETRRDRAPQTPLRIIAIGRLVEVKNHRMLLEALSEVKSKGTRVRLDIIGEGPLRPLLQSEIHRLHLDEEVRLLGFRSDVRERLAKGHLFVLPSHSEGCSISLIEAMAAGVLPLVSRAEGNLEVLGELAPDCSLEASDARGWARKLCSLARLPEPERAAWARRAQTRAYQAFSPTRYLAELRDLYRALTAGPLSPSNEHILRPH